MATYNGELFIEEQIASILCQLSDQDELIVSDDSSTDATVSIIEAFRDARIRLLKDNIFRNSLLNFDNALRHATHDLIFLADQDDIWARNKVDILSKLLEEYDMVVSDCSLVDNQGCVVEDSFYQLRGSGPGLVSNFIKNSYLGCCMAFNRKLLDKALPIPPAAVMHDIWLGMIAELHGRIYFCPDKLVFYRRHEANSTPTATNISTNSFFTQVRIRLGLVLYLILRLAFPPETICPPSTGII